MAQNEMRAKPTLPERVRSMEELGIKWTRGRADAKSLGKLRISLLLWYFVNRQWKVWLKLVEQADEYFFAENDCAFND